MLDHPFTTKRLDRLIHQSTKTLFCFALLGSLATVPVFAQGFAESSRFEHGEYSRVPPELVQVVRESTKQFFDPAIAIYAGYQPVLGCVSGPDHGAMGVHYLNGALLNGEVDATRPQALIYEPLGGRRSRLVGVEYIVDSATWFKKQKEQGVTNPGPPALYGQLFQLVPSPNRYNLDTFFELHVWAWQENPNGTFVDWNTQVNCDRQGKTL